MRTLQKLAVAAVSATLLAAPAAAQQKHQVNQVVATVSFAFLPVYVAEHAGFFAEEGVELKTTVASTAQAGLAAVASGAGAKRASTPSWITSVFASAGRAKRRTANSSGRSRPRPTKRWTAVIRQPDPPASRRRSLPRKSC